MGRGWPSNTVPEKIRHCMMNPITRLHCLDGWPLTAGRQTMSAPRVTGGGNRVALSIALCDQKDLMAWSIRSFVVAYELLQGWFYKDTPCTFCSRSGKPSLEASDRKKKDPGDEPQLSATLNNQCNPTKLKDTGDFSLRSMAENDVLCHDSCPLTSTSLPILTSPFHSSSDIDSGDILQSPGYSVVFLTT